MNITKVQREVLELLKNGKIMVVDERNLPFINGKFISPQTRDSLTDNCLICKKDKNKRVRAKGNGFVITEKGLEILSKSFKKKKVQKIHIKEKRCQECKNIKGIEEFVTIYEFPNSRGKYCKTCFLLHQQQHAMSLMDGRDYCLYCGLKISKVYDWTPEDRSHKTYLHRDHMDPLSLGGEDIERNTVYCCVTCNLRKGNKFYKDWLKELEPKYREIAYIKYVKSHGRTPEEFIQSEPNYAC
ncbi:MAG: HNH endonuclease [Porticoccaceae bacterium]